jgi:hypothetical protein
MRGHRSEFVKRSIILFSILFFFSLDVIAQEADATADPPVAEIYLAKDDGTGKPGDPATSFVVTDIPIFLVVQLSTGRPATVKMNLVAAKVPGVKADTKVVSTAYTTKDLQDRVNFTGRPHGNWVAGVYRADVYIDDKLVKSVTFAITEPARKPQVPGALGSRTQRARIK